ncbi:MAG: type II secretion system F family protein [Candidatus Micrarchaeia archaeon]
MARAKRRTLVSALKETFDLQKALLHADVPLSPFQYLLITLGAFLVFAGIGIMIFPKLFGIGTITSASLGIAIAGFSSWGFLVVMAERKKKELEEALPDTLLLIATNMRAGATIDRAMSSIIPHSFGAMRKELDITSRELASGVPLEVAFRNLAERSPSPLVKNVCDMVIYGIEAGGDMTDLLIDTSFEIRMTQTLQKEVAAQVTTYRTFFVFTVLIVSPILLAVATNFLAITKAFSSQFRSELQDRDLPPIVLARGGIVVGFVRKLQTEGLGGRITVQDMRIFSYSLCTVSSIISCLLLGIISDGEMRAGIKYIPIFVIVSLSVYFYADQFATQMLNEAFGGLLSQ